MKRKITVIVLLALALSLMLTTASAASTTTAKKLGLKLETHTYWAGVPACYTVFTENLPEDAKLVSIKSSKPKVLRAEKWGSDKWDCVVTPLKPGKSKVTVTYKIDGKKVAVSGTFTVKKYPNAIKKLTFNKKAINLKKYPFEVDNFKQAAKTITIKVTPASGWKLVSPIEILSEGCSYKTVKNGKSVKISLSKPRVAALITLKNKLGEEFEYFINITE